MKSLFWRYLTLTLMLLLVCFSLFGVCFIWQSYSYTIGELQSMLEDDSKIISDLTKEFFENQRNPNIQIMFWASIRAITNNNSEHIILCDEQGQLLYYFNGEIFEYEFTDKISENIMLQIYQNGIYIEAGTLGGAYSSATYTCGRIVLDSNGIIIGAVFVSSPAASGREMFQYYQKIFFIIGAVVLVIGTFVSYIMATNMSRPLRGMIKASRAYAMGDFSVRVPEDRTDEIGELAHSLNQMSASLNKLEELRSSFIANVSHELKTPMTTIAGFTDGLLDGTIPAERQKEFLTLISNDTRRLSRLVVRMLEASRLSSGEIELHLTKFEICEMIRLNILEFESRINEKNLTIDIYFEEDEMYVTADQDNIAQVIYNILDNACKYVDQDGVMRVSVTHEGIKTSISVSNTGSEISKEMLPYVFDRFYKTDQSRGLDSSSMGLGLFIVKSIINMHGEEIFVTSANGVTTFTFSLATTDKTPNNNF